jgi:FtsH-binding integral membrane protein
MSDTFASKPTQLLTEPASSQTLAEPAAAPSSAEPARAPALAIPERSLLNRVLGWLGLSLLITAIGVIISPLPWNALIDLFGNGLPLLVVTFLVGLGLLFAINRAASAQRTGLAAMLFLTFALVEGVFIGPLVWSYISDGAYNVVVNALVATFGVFLVAVAVVWLTNRSFAAWGRWLLSALLVGIVLLLAALLVPIPALLLNVAIGLVFIGLTIFDFWRVKARYTTDRSGILLSVSLYLDFVNLFLIFLRIFGRRR